MKRLLLVIALVVCAAWLVHACAGTTPLAPGQPSPSQDGAAVRAAAQVDSDGAAATNEDRRRLLRIRLLDSATGAPLDDREFVIKSDNEDVQTTVVTSGADGSVPVGPEGVAILPNLATDSDWFDAIRIDDPADSGEVALRCYGWLEVQAADATTPTLIDDATVLVIPWTGDNRSSVHTWLRRRPPWFPWFLLSGSLMDRTYPYGAQPIWTGSIWGRAHNILWPVP